MSRPGSDSVASRRRTYLGYRGDDADTPFGSFFRPDMATLPRHVVDGLEHGPLAAPVLLALVDAPSLLDDGDHPTENGFGVLRDGSIQVSVRTLMAGVTPAMWDWWFGWHGCDSRRYKLWHPRAHVAVRWADGEDDNGRRGRDRYVGRTSLVDEYLGSTFARAAIQFVAPRTLGLDEARLAEASRSTAVCARLGAADLPIDVGWFVHHIRAVEGGSEMRSRFWLGGPHVAGRGGVGRADRALRPIAARRLAVDERSARALYVHCAQEMNHLAAFLPELHRRFGDE